MKEEEKIKCKQYAEQLGLTICDTNSIYLFNIIKRKYELVYFSYPDPGAGCICIYNVLKSGKKIYTGDEKNLVKNFKEFKRILNKQLLNLKKFQKDQKIEKLNEDFNK